MRRPIASVLRALDKRLGHSRWRPAVREDLWQALRDVVRWHNDRRYSRVGQPPRGLRPVTVGDVQFYVNEVELLVQGLCVPDAGRSEGALSLSLEVDEAGATAFELPAREARLVSFSLSERGGAAVRGLRTVLNDADWSAARSLLDEALAGARGEREKAFALFEFCRRNALHGPAPAASRDTPAALDPALFFSHFGYGLCGFRASTFSVLCAMAGLECRVWNIGVHTFPEVRIESSWCVLDPDAETWFPNPGATDMLLGVAEIAADPAWAFRWVRMSAWYEERREALIRAFADTSKHRIVSTGAQLLEQVEAEGPACIELDLEVGERIAWHRDPPSGWKGFDRLFPALSPPPPLSSLLATQDLVGRSSARFHGAADRDVEVEDGGVRVRANTSVAVRVDKPFPLIDVCVSVRSEDAGVVDALILTARGAGEAVVVAPVSREGGVAFYRLRRALMGEAACEPVDLTFTFGRAGRITAWSVAAVYQISRFALPRLVPGDNRLRCVSGTSGATFDVEGTYDLGARVPPAPPVALRTPDSSGAMEWEHVCDESQCLSYRWRVLDERGERAIAPWFDRVTRAPRLMLDELERRCLAEWGASAWQVQVVDELRRPLTSWSDPYSLEGLL